MHGCLRLLLGLVSFWAVGALVTWLLPLGDQSKNASDRSYYQNAREAVDFINSNPLARLLRSVLVVRTEVSDLRRVPSSCNDGTDNGLPHYRDVVATVTDYAIWGIPVQHYGTSCAGMVVHRGRPDYRLLPR